MRYKYRPIKGYRLRIDELHKYVNVSKSGHGIIIQRTIASRLAQAPLHIVHVFGNKEGPHGKEKLPGLKAMSRKYRYLGQAAIYDDTAFRIKAYGFNSNKTIWKEVKIKKNELGLSLDVNKTFHKDNNLMYRWIWSRKDMFDPEKQNKTYYSSVKIEYPTNLLYYQIAFGVNTCLEGTPILLKIDSSGNEKVLKRLMARHDMHEDHGMHEMNKEDVSCRYYWVVLKKPELGSTYKIVWKIKEPGGD